MNITHISKKTNTQPPTSKFRDHSLFMSGGGLVRAFARNVESVFIAYNLRQYTCDTLGFPLPPLVNVGNSSYLRFLPKECSVFLNIEQGGWGIGF